MRFFLLMCLIGCAPEAGLTTNECAVEPPMVDHVLIVSTEESMFVGEGAEIPALPSAVEAMRDTADEAGADWRLIVVPANPEAAAIHPWGGWVDADTEAKFVVPPNATLYGDLHTDTALTILADPEFGFREGAMPHLIFLSDGDDPGAEWWDDRWILVVAALQKTAAVTAIAPLYGSECGASVEHAPNLSLVADVGIDVCRQGDWHLATSVNSSWGRFH